MLRRLALLVLPVAGACVRAAVPETPADSHARESSSRSAQPLITGVERPADLGRMAAGRVALVSFWATWCEACLKEVDPLNRLAARARERGDALVVGIAVGESLQTVDAFVRTHAITIPQVVDADFHLADALGQRTIPATLVFDRNGVIVYRGQSLDAHALAAFRRALGEDQPVTAP
jgi:peroxiredoxin